ncbi:hypothetical protein [Helicobacter winghamensis]|uniref:Periplasmic protein n=1 Tax=Helicobacter winghamensis TaxID=157268 RepID=A0A2N3PIT0_9HELI|nr:hypothetical protein [Helicobacter winghamensis]EEO25289.1 hypothetical protein HWAG_00081 [Helicobacter winghamensis ATCC BAA-430]PKT76331.1 hypothetical protein BCM35_06315 [Helicobacter winghamensis]PKT76462.1 hypothetical protein BCM32_03470 [Helicobacter winghamensis]PKT76593.1 hypothetical protein BCM34_04845 [Helicobacter winghamensis]PKT80842.1 hypothetical protein BCM31_02455 [Helicobacter winghamensis]
MFKRIILCLMVLMYPQFILASGKYLSPLPLPSAEVLNLESRSCSTSCLRNYLENGQVFSFIANINKENQNEAILTELNTLLSALEISEIPYFVGTQKPFFSVALMFPRKSIGRYSSTTTNVILSYLLSQKGRFNFEIFDSKTESLEDMQAVLQDIYAKGYRQVIAVVTQDGANAINTINPNMLVFIPSVHKAQLQEISAPNVIFGGISYAEQIQKLSDLNPSVSATSFYDGSLVGQQMQAYTQEANPNLIYSQSFNLKQNPNFHKEIKNLKSTLRSTRIFLNTPVTNSSIILSQLTFNDIRPQAVYSTQINYNPSLLSITQERDRANMYVANSIMPLDGLLLENAKFLNADLEYNWINYTTAFGIEYFYTKSVPGAKRYFKEKILHQQVQYNIEILKPTNTRFAPLKP